MNDRTSGGLGIINPVGSFDEVILLEVLSECVDEFSGSEILDGEEGLLCLSNHEWLK